MEDGQISYQFRVKLCGKDKFFGPGVAELMHYVDELRSLNKAAAKMHMAYSKAWKIIGHAEEELGYALLERKIGGTGGGGARLTAEGRELLWRYEQFLREAEVSVDTIFKKYFN